MFAALESYVHAIRRRLSRNEWAVRHLGLTPVEGSSEAPGLLLIQIDGFGREQMQRALAAKKMPFLQRLISREGYDVHTFYPGLPTTTPAVQAELYYGVKSAVPAFAFFDRVLKKHGRMWDPEWAKAREAACAAQAEGLLKGGSSWSNIYTGGAGQQESHFCAASIGLGDMWRTKKIRNIFVFILLNLTAALRIAWLLLVEFGVGLSDMIRAVFSGRRFYREFLLLVSRVFVGVGLRELLTISGQIDVTRGLPIVHINFVGYDEESHVRGPGSRLAHYGLRAIDRSIKQIVRAAHRSRRRDYAVWIFSDHGQEPTKPFADKVPGGVEAVLRECLELAQKHDPAFREPSSSWKTSAWLSRGKFNQARLERERAADPVVTEGEVFSVAALGPVGHVYFTQPKTDEQRRALAERLVRQGQVPGVLMRAQDGTVTWFHERGTTRVPDEVAPLLPHPEGMREEIARDMKTFCENPNMGDLTLMGWSPWGDTAYSFAAERGAHGGFGPHETQGFVLLPPNTPLPENTQHFIRPSALRTAALYHIGRCETPSCRTMSTPPRTEVRLMTYNVHGCSGMDGRVSPRRVARAIRGQMPDIVALQEIDLGRRRSRAEDQAAIIARELGMHVVFCPTVTRGEEHYGHALLSHWPIEIVRRARLPHDPKSWWQEPRSAIWARVDVAGRIINVVTAHLGLGPYERELQVKALMSSEWLGDIIDREPILLCGDFNALPGSRPYRMAAGKLRDVQLAAPAHRPMNTFSSLQPIIRLDHIFASKHFTTMKVAVVRNDLTRVASDHLPLMADLRVGTAPGDTSTTTPQKSTAHTPPAQPAALG